MPGRLPALVTPIALAVLATACAQRTTSQSAPQPAPQGEHDGHGGMTPSQVPQPTARVELGDTTLPPSAATADARVASSPRHGEYVMIAAGPAPTDSVRAWVVYPERKTKAPVVVVIHEIFGLTSWVRGVADQLAADGYIAIAPDLLTGKRLPGAPDSIPRDSVIAAVRALDPAVVARQVEGVARYGMSLPAALPKWGVTGFCWGGSMVFATAANAPTLGAAVAYYGGSPVDRVQMANTKAPVLGLYGENDARVNATIPAADSTLRQAGARFEHVVYPGAGHGFLRQQDGQNGANLAATRAAWPRTLEFFRKNLGA
jgi:carboxymethylenebutenolidase